jgi:hypothetical protein
MRIKCILLSLSLVAAFGASVSNAAPIITNGNFELTSNGTNKQLTAGYGTTASNRTTLDGWYSSPSNTGDGGYNFVLENSKAGTSGSVKYLKNYTSSSNGGNVFASDAQYGPGALSQYITGLTAGTQYLLSFEYAIGQQSGFGGSNVDNYWQVAFGTAASYTIQNTSKITIAESEFSGWKTASMLFTANDSNQWLQFLAKGGSNGAPPFMLLDGVSMDVKAVPEPSTISLLLGGAGLVGFMARRRRTRQA